MKRKKKPLWIYTGNTQSVLKEKFQLLTHLTELNFYEGKCCNPFFKPDVHVGFFFFFTLNFNLKHIRRQFAVAYKSMVQGVATFRLVWQE